MPNIVPSFSLVGSWVVCGFSLSFVSTLIFVECKPCVIEMPELNEIVQKYKSEEVVFLAFALNE